MKTDVIKRAEVFAAIVISLLILFLLIVRARHAGGLWRDECATMRLATIPTSVAMSWSFPFPLLLSLIVRVHSSLFGISDLSLRCLGVGTGVALIGVAWLSARWTRGGAPLILLSVLGLNATFLTWGTTIRGYGLGSVAIVLAVSLAARVLNNPTRANLIALLLTFLAGPQLLVHDAALMLAIASAAIAVCVIRRRWKLALILLVMAGVTILSCLPFLVLNVPGNSNIVLKYPTSFAGLWYNFKIACGPPQWLAPMVWSALVCVALGGAIYRLAATRRAPPSRESNLLLFGISVVVISAATYFVFLRVLNYWPHPWYYLPLLGVMAAAIDLIIGTLSTFRGAGFARLVFAIAISPVLAFATWPKLIERQTNMDMIAHSLEENAAPSDLIVVNPWDRGVSFNWYYHGSARWVTVPMMSEYRIHRYDLLKAKMMSANPLDDLFESIAQTLRSGRQVWLVGGAQWLKPGEIPHWLPPAPNSEFGWNNDAYRNSWSQQLGAFLQQHVEQAEISPAPGISVNEVEKEPVWRLAGWHE
ncbi:MAG: hypothetical protein ABI925_07765 [Verrucomicrobiota bacterium]